MTIIFSKYPFLAMCSHADSGIVDEARALRLWNSTLDLVCHFKLRYLNKYLMKS